MAIQKFQVSDVSSGESVYMEIFLPTSDTIAATIADTDCVEAVNRLGVYVGTLDPGLAAGLYFVVVKALSDDYVLATGWVTLVAAADNTVFIVYDVPFALLATQTSVDALVSLIPAGPYDLDFTITGDAAALVGAKIRITKDGLSSVGVTITGGLFTFPVDAGDYEYRVLAVGFTGETGTVTVTDDTPVAVDLTSLGITPSVDPGTTTGYLTALDEAGEPEVGAMFTTAMVAAPAGSVGYGFDTKLRVVYSAGGGLTQFPGMIKGAAYYIYRGTKKVKVNVLVPMDAGATWEIPSFIGSDETGSFL